MNIISKQSAIHLSKPEGTEVDYFLFPGYEVHYNEQLPGTTQAWHRHEKIWETLYIIEGELTAKWREGDQEKTQIVKAGDLIESEYTSHTFTNHTNETAKFLIIKQVLSGQDNGELFKTDKVND